MVLKINYLMFEVILYMSITIYQLIINIKKTYMVKSIKASAITYKLHRFTLYK